MTYTVNFTITYENPDDVVIESKHYSGSGWGYRLAADIQNILHEFGCVSVEVDRPSVFHPTTRRATSIYYPEG